MEKTRLFCFPYAGGSAAIYNQWKQYCGNNIEIVPVELAGRGKRINEPVYEDLDDIVADMFSVLKKEIDNCSSYVLFGHSLGGLIVYRLAHKIRQLSMLQPAGLFISGHSAPHIVREDEKKYHLMDDEQFKQEVIRLGGTPPEFFDHPELLELFLPLLRNDFRIAESYVEDCPIVPFDQNLTVFLGRDDDLTVEQRDGWRQYTSRLCTIHYFPGGHFFLHDEAPVIVKLVATSLGQIQEPFLLNR